jgi:hypothetical protein
VFVLGYLLTPRNRRSRPIAAMICLPGHGRGVEDIVGIDRTRWHDRTNKPGYQHDFAMQVVEHGMAAVAIEPIRLSAAGAIPSRARKARRPPPASPPPARRCCSARP